MAGSRSQRSVIVPETVAPLAGEIQLGLSVGLAHAIGVGVGVGVGGGVGLLTVTTIWAARAPRFADCVAHSMVLVPFDAFVLSHWTAVLEKGLAQEVESGSTMYHMLSAHEGLVAGSRSQRRVTTPETVDPFAGVAHFGASVGLAQVIGVGVGVGLGVGVGAGVGVGSGLCDRSGADDESVVAADAVGDSGTVGDGVAVGSVGVPWQAQIPIAHDKTNAVPA